MKAELDAARTALLLCQFSDESHGCFIADANCHDVHACSPRPGGGYSFEDVEGMPHMSNTLQFQFGPATLSDLQYTMTTERSDGYNDLVGRWTEERHREALGDGVHAYFLGRSDNEPVGFVILRDWAACERVTLIKRIAVSRPGHGIGTRLLGAVVDHVFQETDAHRIWLGVFPENLRARRAYEAIGFVPEGVARGAAFFGGTRRDELIMAILRTDARRSR